MGGAGRWGYWIHDYLDYNPSKEEVLSRREQGKKRVKNFRKRNASGNDDVTQPVTQMERASNDEVHVPPAPSPFVSRKALASRKKEIEKSFVVFWEKYPRKVAKDLALKTWMKIAPTPEQVQRILAAVEGQSRGIGALAPSKIEGTTDWRPHPSTWLNAGRWTDEVAIVATGGRSDPNYFGVRDAPIIKEKTSG